MSTTANKLPSRSVAANTNESIGAAASSLAVGSDTGAERTDFPCSVTQERFWLLDRLEPGNNSYNVAVRWRLEGHVSSELLERAWHIIIERHEILRTVFLEVDGAPVQRIQPHSHFRLAEIDLSTLPPDQQQTEGDRIGVIEARAPFDVETGPLIRVTLLRFSATLSIILVTTHQIVSDGWSVGVMAREMGVIYEALRHGKPDPLEPLAIQYADYSLWQLEWLRVRGTAAETAYWTERLAGVQPFKVIPDRPRPAMPTTNGIIVSRVLPRDLTNRAQTLCAQHGATLFAAALGALCAMLARYTRRDEVVLGTQVSDRNQVELEGMIGQFVNSLILRNDMKGDPRFTDIIERVRDTTAQALEYRHIPIERLLGMVKGHHGKANSPPISVNFIFQKTFIQNTTYTDFSLIDMPSLPAGAIYDLNFFMVERPDGWRFSLQYNTDQFEHATANRLLDYFENVLEGAVAEPQRRISQLRLTAPLEARRLFDQLNKKVELDAGGVGLTGGETRTVVNLIESHFVRSPKSCAVSHAGRSLSYEELHSLSERLANGLRSRGTGLGSRVGICVDRSPDLLGVILAVLKAGASCILLDPADPAEFLRRRAEHAKLSAVVVSGATRQLWSGTGGVVIDMEDLLSDRSATRQLTTQPVVTPLTEAFVGPAGPREAGPREAGPRQDGQREAGPRLVARQTGPRPVPRPSDNEEDATLSHGALAHLLLDVGRMLTLEPRDGLVASCPLGSEVAFAELLLPLVFGARVILAGSKEVESPRALTQLLKRSNATCMHAMARTWQVLHQSGWSGPAGFKMLCSRGILTGATAQHLMQQGAELWSLYNAAGAGIWSAVNRVQSRADVAFLGSPVGGWAFTVVDAKNQLTEVGTTGDLMLRHVTRATARKTGDLARLRDSGQIEWLGRSDRRFLHDGYLIDPDDIEEILRRHPQVTDVRVAEGPQSLQGRLVACVAAHDASQTTAALAAALQADLVRLMPAPMVPKVIVANGTLPLESDGTLNWRALHLTESADAGAAPERLHGVEEELAAIWRSLLGVDDIEPTANFFELGGHSLLAARMLTRVHAVFGRRVTLNNLFRAPSIRQLAQLLERKHSRDFDFRQMVKLQPNGSRPPLIAINNTGTYYPLAKCLGEDQPVISMQLFDPSVKMDAMPETLEEVAAGYVQLIQRVQPKGPYALMGWCVAGALSFEIARQLVALKQEVSNLYLMDAWAPRYIQRQPIPRRWIAAFSLRLQLMLADWRLVASGDKSFASFILERNLVKGLASAWQRIRRLPVLTSAAAEQISEEAYDEWLLHYLQSITAKYQPGHFPGKLTLFRSVHEPTGWFFDPLAGWGAHADEVELVMVDGNHFTMFHETGARQMAAHIGKFMPDVEPAAS